MDPQKDQSQEVFSHNKRNANIMHVEDTILATSAEASIYEYWFLLNSQST